MSPPSYLPGGLSTFSPLLRMSWRPKMNCGSSWRTWRVVAQHYPVLWLEPGQVAKKFCLFGCLPFPVPGCRTLVRWRTARCCFLSLQLVLLQASCPRLARCREVTPPCGVAWVAGHPWLTTEACICSLCGSSEERGGSVGTRRGHQMSPRVRSPRRTLDRREEHWHQGKACKEMRCGSSGFGGGGPSPSLLFFPF